MHDLSRYNHLTRVSLLCQMDMKEKTDRIEELEAALRESVTITAQREMLMAQQQQKLEQGEKQVRRTAQ